MTHKTTTAAVTRAMPSVLAISAGAMLAVGSAWAQTAEAIDPAIFPQAEAGYTQHVLAVAPRDDEGSALVEIVVGQTMSLDCNQVVMRADLEEETLEGWGYTYYKVDDISKPASTLMGCPDNSTTERFIGLHFGQDAFVRYNSKLPLVIYAPENLTVGYRIWQTDGILQGQSTANPAAVAP